MKTARARDQMQTVLRLLQREIGFGNKGVCKGLVSEVQSRLQVRVTADYAGAVDGEAGRRLVSRRGKLLGMRI